MDRMTMTKRLAFFDLPDAPNTSFWRPAKSDQFSKLKKNLEEAILYKRKRDFSSMAKLYSLTVWTISHL